MIVHNQRQFYIDGEWVDPLEPSNLEVINPATEESAATISVGTFDDVDLAVKAARRAFDSYSASSKSERLDLLQNILRIYKNRYDEMAEIISLELGAPISMSQKSQAACGVGHLESFITALGKLELQQKLDEIGEHHGIPESGRHFLNGTPAREIRRFAEEHGMDLIVLGTHGQKGVQLLLGATANSV